MVADAARAEAAQRAAGLKQVSLDGFEGEVGWNAVCLEMRSPASVFWPNPATLSAPADLAARDSIRTAVTGEPTSLDADEHAARRLPGP